MLVTVFEDEAYHSLLPLVYTRPVCDLRCGAFTLRERLVATLAAECYANVYSTPAILCRTHLMEHYGPTGGYVSVLAQGVPLILVNARAVDVNWLPSLIQAPLETVYMTNGVLLGAKISPALASSVLTYLRYQQADLALAELQRFGRTYEVASALITYPWDLITQNGEQIIRDVPLMRDVYTYKPFDVVAANYPHVVAYQPEQIYVAPGVQLQGPLVLDARNGPIIIGNAHVEPFSFIQGPTVVGNGSLISSARIRGETSIGPVCRLGGEIEASIIQGYSNKHHDGFLGHSFVGEWVNIGAMTTTSDLKNTYSTIRVTLDGQTQIDSGTIKLGTFMADHVKLGIGVHLSSGSIIGTASNIFGVHTGPKTVSPFTWGGDQPQEYHIDRMVAVARKVMGRRDQELTPTYEALLRTVFSLTHSSRATIEQTVPFTSAEPVLTLLDDAETDALHAYEFPSIPFYLKAQNAA